MKWKADWWGITVDAENEADNALIDKLDKSLDANPIETYDGGELEFKTNNGLKSIVFNR